MAALLLLLLEVDSEDILLGFGDFFVLLCLVGDGACGEAAASSRTSTRENGPVGIRDTV